MSKSALLALFAVAALFSAANVYAEKKAAAHPAKQWSAEIPKDQRIEHALNRLTFGPRPEDAAQVKSMGLNRWMELQLHPERIPENPVLAEKLATLDSLRLTSAELIRDYPGPQIVKQMVAGRLPFPDDPERRMMVQKLVARFERKQQAGGDQAANPAMPDTKALTDLLSRDQIRKLRTGTPAARMAALEALPAGQQDEVIAALGAGMRQAIYPVATPALRRKLELANGPAQVVARDLMEAKVLRAVYSPRQLEEVLDDFWFNHFNVFLEKGADRYLVTEYEREAIRPHVLGKFRDLLEATAKSPAMLFYLDNWQSAGPNAPQPRNAKGRRGLNENYGRELMELHTLGVNGGGYTQKDVTEVARCFTGWTIIQPQNGGKFTFNPRIHDNGEKVVLGVRIPAGGGQSDGEKVLDILARNPATAHFISRKLAMRFVADDPPESLVEHMAATFQKTDGDIRAVLETMLKSREFWSQGAYRSKMKSPFEMVVSAVRASHGDVDFAFALVNQVAQLGEPLYRKIEPTGYSNASEEWMNTAGLMARMNFAVQLASNKVPGVKVEKPAEQEGMALGSPEFQKR